MCEQHKRGCLPACTFAGLPFHLYAFSFHMHMLLSTCMLFSFTCICFFLSCLPLTISHLKIDFSRSSHLNHVAASLVCYSSRPTEVEHNFSLSMDTTYKPAYNSHCMANVWPRVDHLVWGNLPIHTKQEGDFFWQCLCMPLSFFMRGCLHNIFICILVSLTLTLEENLLQPQHLFPASTSADTQLQL